MTAGDGVSPDDLVARAIRDLIHSVPGDPDEPAPAESNAQPWAETASPSAKNKRPLEDLVADFSERVAAAPDARAGRIGETHPSLAFYERFGRSSARQEGQAQGQRRKRRRRFGAGRRSRGGGGGGGGGGAAAGSGGGGGGGRGRPG